MAVMIPTADGNLSDTSNFAVIETGTSAAQLLRANNNTLNGSSVTSPTFTFTNGVTVDAILLSGYQQNSPGACTLKVDLQKGGVSQASVTVNRTDLPDGNRWQVFNWQGEELILFKLPSTVTGDGGTNWTIVLTASSGGSNFVFHYSGATNNFFRALRTTTKRAPTTGDDILILGELTGAGTHNSRTITMDSTAATVFGSGLIPSTSNAISGIFVGNFGKLAYGVAASTNYVLRINGVMEVFQNGTLNISEPGNELPRSSTAVLEFVQNSQTGDFGLFVHQNGVFNCVGLSRTSGKNYSITKLTSNADGSGNLLDGAGGSMTNASWVNNAIPGGADGVLMGNPVLQDNSTNGNHAVAFGNQNSVAGNTTLTLSVTLTRGNGTNNRYVRVYLGDSNTPASISTGFYVDVDLQSGTLGTPAATGTGSVSGATITAVGNGYVVRMTGILSTATKNVCLNLMSASALGTVSYAGNSTYCFGFTSMGVFAVGSLSNSTVNVADDTGWLAGDTVMIARTDRGNFDSTSQLVLTSNAGSSSFVTPQIIAGSDRGTNLRGAIHSGASPLQAYAGNMTRNIKIRSTSPTLWAYIMIEALASVNIQWTEIYYMGNTSGQTEKNGLEIWGTSSGQTAAKTISYCSIHDCYYGLMARTFNGSGSLNLTFTNNIIYGISQSAIFINGNFTVGDWTISNNLAQRTNNTCIVLQDVAGTFNGNWFGGNYNGQAAVQISNLSLTPSPIGSFDSNYFVSSGEGITISGAPSGIMSNITMARSNTYNLDLSVTPSGGLFFTSCNMFGAGTANLRLQNQDIVHLWSSRMAGDTTYSTPINVTISGPAQLDFQNVDMSGTGSIYAPATTNDIAIANAYLVTGVLNGCLQKSSNSLGAKTNWSPDNWISYQKFNGTAGDHRTEMFYGQIKTDTTIFNTASPSVRMTPNSATKKLRSAPAGRGFIVACANGQSVNIGINIRKSSAGDGAAYNGNQPRLIQVANPAMGQNSDVVIATYSAATGAWNQISGTSSTATDDGAWEFYIDCDGTVGWINFDDWSIS